MKIYGCPYCKEYLAKTDSYNYCMYCGAPYDKNKLIILVDDKNEEESNGLFEFVH